MSNNQSIVYVMRHIDIGGNIDIPYKKIGITGAGSSTLTSRLQQISNTKSPIKAQCIAAWKHDDARKIENAIHQLLEDCRVEGEWFLDKDDTLVERIQPLMELIGAEEEVIEDGDDSYTKNIMKKEEKAKSSSHQTLMLEVSELLDSPLRSTISKRCATLFSDKTNLTYYMSSRKSGRHNMSIGRSKSVYEALREYIESDEYEVEQGRKGHARIMGVSAEAIAKIINKLEHGFSGK